MIRKCIKCGEEKDLYLFVKDKTRLMGRRNECKTCCNKRILEQVKLYQRSKKGKDSIRAYKNNNATKISESKMRYNKTKEEAVKLACRKKLNGKIRNGKIVKRSICEICYEIKTECHHDDYSKPFDFVELCKRCHIAIHKQMPV